mgnify:CR=1 FL=1
MTEPTMKRNTEKRVVDHQYWAHPKQARSLRAEVDDGWWYANRGNIEIHADARVTARHVVLRITRSQLLDYISKSAAHARAKRRRR